LLILAVGIRFALVMVLPPNDVYTVQPSVESESL
jgi:hypothetical protein